MRNSKRIRRMGRNKIKVTGLNLTSLMDVFTILPAISPRSMSRRIVSGFNWRYSLMT